MNTERYVATDVNHCKNSCGTRCVSWSSIIIAAFIALGLSFLLNLFSTAIGLSIYSVDTAGVSTLKIGGILGFAIGIIVVMFFSGWIAGHYGRSHCDKKCCGALYGLASWCIALVLMVIFASSSARFVTSYTNYLANTTFVAENNMGTMTKPVGRVGTVTVQADKETLGDLSKGAFVLFAMFFLGALASTIGGYVGGISCQHKECYPGCKCGKCGTPS
jgi:hypothetical protein